MASESRRGRASGGDIETTLRAFAGVLQDFASVAPELVQAPESVGGMLIVASRLREFSTTLLEADTTGVDIPADLIALLNTGIDRERSVLNEVKAATLLGADPGFQVFDDVAFYVRVKALPRGDLLQLSSALFADAGRLTRYQRVTLATTLVKLGAPPGVLAIPWWVQLLKIIAIVILVILGLIFTSWEAIIEAIIGLLMALDSWGKAGGGPFGLPVPIPGWPPGLPLPPGWPGAPRPPIGPGPVPGPGGTQVTPGADDTTVVTTPKGTTVINNPGGPVIVVDPDGHTRIDWGPKTPQPTPQPPQPTPQPPHPGPLVGKSGAVGFSQIWDFCHTHVLTVGAGKTLTLTYVQSANPPLAGDAVLEIKVNGQPQSPDLERGDSRAFAGPMSVEVHCGGGGGSAVVDISLT